MAMMKDLGWNVTGEVKGDPSAALGIIHRKGCGKVRHIDTQLLWMQQRDVRGDMAINKVDGKENPADLMTKGLDEATTVLHLARMGFKFQSGRADKSVTLE